MLCEISSNYYSSTADSVVLYTHLGKVTFIVYTCREGVAESITIPTFWKFGEAEFSPIETTNIPCTGLLAINTNTSFFFTGLALL